MWEKWVIWRRKEGDIRWSGWCVIGGFIGSIFENRVCVIESMFSFSLSSELYCFNGEPSCVSGELSLFDRNLSYLSGESNWFARNPRSVDIISFISYLRIVEKFFWLMNVQARSLWDFLWFWNFLRMLGHTDGWF